MDITVQRIDQRPDVPADDQVVKWLIHAASDLGVSGGEVTVRFVEQQEMHALNRAWRGADRPTNVLSFPMEAPDTVPVDLLGDIVVCADVVIQEAAEYAVTPLERFAHMIVHGFLHLNGFDHVDTGDATRMESAETRILRALGFEDPWRPEACAT